MIKLRKHQQRVVNKMLKHQRGQLIVPTGGGKTMCMITDAMSQFSSSNKTIVVVAPRILLTQQLCEDFLEIIGLNDLLVRVMHVHSGDTSHYSTTKSRSIFDWAVNNWKKNKLIFTTYHSLFIEYKSLVFLLIQYTLMKHIIVFRNIFSLLLNIFHLVIVGAISLLLHLNIVILSRE
jgi:superfamily II DNA or RNA helicase